MSQDRFEIEPEPRSWSLLPHWDWVFMISLGWLLFELFAQPAIGVLVASLRFGWPEVLNARWLLRRDPDHFRARTCATFCLAYGFFRISVLTLGLVVLAFVIALFVAQNVVVRGNIPIDARAMRTAGWIIGSSFLMTALISTAGTWMAWQGRYRVWVGKGLADCRARSQWPPQPSGPNEACSMLNIVIVLVPIWTGLSALVFLLPGHHLSLILFVTLMVLLAVVLLIANDRIRPALTADVPMNCWGLPESGSEEHFLDDEDDFPDDVFEDDPEDAP